MEAAIFIGIQASGKSHFYKERFFNSHVRISLDLLTTRHREALMLQLCLKTQQPFVIDNTNAKAEDRVRYIEPAKERGYRIIGYFFEPDIGEALKRNEMRSGPLRVPKPAIFATAKRLQRPMLQEGFHQLFLVRSGPDQTFVVDPWPEEHNSETAIGDQSIQAETGGSRGLLSRGSEAPLS
jgi:predicted kinase